MNAVSPISMSFRFQHGPARPPRACRSLKRQSSRNAPGGCVPRANAKLHDFLARQVGATRQILVETEERGRTEHYAPVRFAHAMRPGAIITATVTAHKPGHLEVRPGA